HHPGVRQCARSIVGSRARDDRDSSGNNFCRDLDNATLFVRRHCRRLSGRPAWDDVVDPLLYLPRDEAAQCFFVQLASGSERSDYRGASATQHGNCRFHRTSSLDNTSSSVKTPRRPISHLAATSAPSANTRLSRASCEMTICSKPPSRISVCVPGTAPTRTLVIGTSRADPSANFSCSMRAVPDGASFFAA